MTDYLSNQSALNKRIKLIIENENIDNHRSVINNIADQLAIDTLTVAAALLHLSQNIEDTLTPSSLKNQTIEPQALTHHRTLNIKMVRYRLDVGSQHLITLEQLKKTLVEESGVDKNNINNIVIIPLVGIVKYENIAIVGIVFFQQLYYCNIYIVNCKSLITITI